ncbi:hypothetical protein M3181_20330 [Mesobacillus maritimus]|uniref:hypothetical protein n=1 Tax=Mesobacillus maritimus TaxID=1643336 RepID=UPI00204097E7|nr:hypothetical protein [Mesobacillus maritimus]MCM3671310.1 hypothetical protein [Mesobacillus maritimus]
MIDPNFIKQGLRFQQFPFYETDLPFIQSILFTMKQAEMATSDFPHLNAEIPITVVDKRLMV